MSYQVIARKYRPQHFADVVGQEHVTQTLANAIKQKRIAHAYLFVGPRGTGKTTIARIFAKCLNCTGGPSDTFSDDDPRCKEITDGRSMDVLEIDGASNRGIEEIRELRETVKYAPSSSKFKIYIIDEVHMLTKEAFNALLKTLEEPPEHVKFMFATTEPEKVLPTILSRCQRFDLRRIPSSLIVSHLAEISKRESVEIEEAALHAIARGAEGGMRDAESTLDQLISFCGTKIVESDVLSMFGLTSRQQILSLTSAILNAETDTAFRELNELAQNGKDLGRLLSDLLGYFRNVLVYQVSKGDTTLLDLSEQEARALKAQAEAASSEALARIMEILSECESKYRDTSSKKILLEVAILKAIQARNAVGIDTVLLKLKELREGGGTTTSGTNAPVATSKAPVTTPGPRSAAQSSLSAATESAQAAAPKATLTPAPIVTASPAPIAPIPVAAIQDLEQLWAALVDAVGKTKRFTQAYLINGFPVSFEKGVFTIGFDPSQEASKSFLEATPNPGLIQSKLKELGHGDAQVRLIKAPAPAGRKPSPAPSSTPAESAPPPPPKVAAPAAPVPPKAVEQKAEPPQTVMRSEEFKNDPLIRKALEIFKGQIVEVRPA